VRVQRSSCRSANVSSHAECRGARQKIAVITTFRKSNKNSLERRVGAYRSSRKRNAVNYDDYDKIKVYEVGIVCSTRGKVEKSSQILAQRGDYFEDRRRSEDIVEKRLEENWYDGMI